MWSDFVLLGPCDLRVGLRSGEPDHFSLKADCATLMRHVDAICFQELSETWRAFIHVECLTEHWKTFSDTTNVMTALRINGHGEYGYVEDIESVRLACFPDPADRRNRHRYWRAAVETSFVLCHPNARRHRRVILVNLHIVSGTAETSLKSSVVPGRTPEARQRFKVTALKNVLTQAHENAAGWQDGLLIVAGDMNLGTTAVQACLSEVAAETSQTFHGCSAVANPKLVRTSRGTTDTNRQPDSQEHCTETNAH